MLDFQQEIEYWFENLDNQKWNMQDVVLAYFRYLSSYHQYINNDNVVIVEFARMMSSFANQNISNDDRRITICKQTLKYIKEQLQEVCNSPFVVKTEKERLEKAILDIDEQMDLLKENPKYFKFKTIYDVLIETWNYIDKDLKYRQLTALVEMDKFLESDAYTIILKEMIRSITSAW